MILSCVNYFSQIQIGSLQHIIPIIVTLVFAIQLIRYSIKKLNHNKQYLVFKGLGFFVSLTVFVFHLQLILKGDYSIQNNLPLYLCSFMALFIFVFTWTRSYLLYEILLFWIIAGTTQAVITPDILDSFPSLEYFRYWIAHLGLLIVIFYATIVLRMRPTIKSVFKSFLALQVYMLFVFCVNYFLGGNYSYLNKKPDSASLLDYFGEWPNYIYVIEVLIIPYFLLIYLPFYLKKAARKKVI